MPPESAVYEDVVLVARELLRLCEDHPKRIPARIDALFADYADQRESQAAGHRTFGDQREALRKERVFPYAPGGGSPWPETLFDLGRSRKERIIGVRERALYWRLRDELRALRARTKGARRQVQERERGVRELCEPQQASSRGRHLSDEDVRIAATSGPADGARHILGTWLGVKPETVRRRIGELNRRLERWSRETLDEE